MRLLLLSVTLIVSVVTYAQHATSADNKLKQQLDSILEEADILYKHEKAAWISTDLVFEESTIKNNIGEYLTYQDNDKIKTIFIDKNGENCIVEYTFKDNFDKPDEITTEERKPTEKEKTLLEVRRKIIDQLSDPQYQVGMPNGYSLNLILMSDGDKYKLYIITGTSQAEIIPFGNDYLFVADSEGNIESWKKFHSTLIPIQTKGPNGEIVIMPVHTHLRTTPLITATDICTFRLYGSLYEMDEFMVYSPALGNYMKYSIKGNNITIEGVFQQK